MFSEAFCGSLCSIYNFRRWKCICTKTAGQNLTKLERSSTYMWNMWLQWFLQFALFHLNRTYLPWIKRSTRSLYDRIQKAKIMNCGDFFLLQFLQSSLTYSIRIPIKHLYTSPLDLQSQPQQDCKTGFGNWRQHVKSWSQLGQQLSSAIRQFCDPMFWTLPNTPQRYYL